MAQAARRTGVPVWQTFHALFALVTVVVLILPLGQTGMKVLGLVVVYNLALPWTARRTGDTRLWRMWAVLAPMSVLMILPDWFLGAVLGTIRFPDTGSPFIGTMPLFMAGMWTMALLPVCMLGRQVEDGHGSTAGFITAAGSGLALFTAAEFLAPAIPLWEPLGVTQVAGVALYVLLPELALCLATYALVRIPLSMAATIAGIVGIPFMYLGMLAVSYQFVGAAAARSPM